MRKRLTAGVAALTAVFALTAPPSAFADYHQRDDKHPPIPCNPYPPGKKFHVRATPSSATVRKGTNINAVAVVERGEGSDRRRCKYHLIILRYAERPGVGIKTHRTSTKGTAAFVIERTVKRRVYSFDLLYNNVYYHSNKGVINVR